MNKEEYLKEIENTSKLLQIAVEGRLIHQSHSKGHWDEVSLNDLADKIVEEFVEVMAEYKSLNRARKSNKNPDYRPLLYEYEYLNKLKFELIDLGSVIAMMLDKISKENKELYKLMYGVKKDE